MTHDLETMSRRLAATTNDVAPSRPPADLWTRGRRVRRRRQVATGVGAAAAVVALVLPAAAVAGFLPEQGDGTGQVAGTPTAAAAPALPDTLYAPGADAPRERAPGPLVAAYAFFVDDNDRERVAGVSAEDGRTVILPGVPSSADQGGYNVAKMALSPDGALLAYGRGGRLEDLDFGRDTDQQELVVRDLRTGDEVVAELPAAVADDLENLRSMRFSGGMLLVSLDRVPGDSLHAVDPSTGDTTALAPTGEPFLWAGASAAAPVFTVGRRVFTGAEPAQGRDPVLQAPAGYSIGAAAVSPDGSRAAVVMSELFDGTERSAPQLQMTSVDAPRVLQPLPVVAEGTQIDAWLPDGRLALRLPQQSTQPDVVEIDQQTWLLLDPDRLGQRERRVVDIAGVDPSGIVVASDALAAPLREAMDPSPFPVEALAVSVVALAAGASVVVLVRRRRRAAR